MAIFAPKVFIISLGVITTGTVAVGAPAAYDYFTSKQEPSGSSKPKAEQTQPSLANEQPSSQNPSDGTPKGGSDVSEQTTQTEGQSSSTGDSGSEGTGLSNTKDNASGENQTDDQSQGGTSDSGSDQKPGSPTTTTEIPNTAG